MNEQEKTDSPDPLIDLRRLISANVHFTPANVSAYINFAADLSSSEAGWVENHLAGCSNCRRLYDRVFDDELEFDRETKSEECRVSTDDEGITFFENSERTIRGEVLQSRLQFHKMPSDIHKISVSTDASVRLRLTHAVCDVPYLLHDINGLSPSPKRMTLRYTVMRKVTVLSFPRVLRYVAAAILVVGASLAVWTATRSSPELPIVDTPVIQKRDSSAAVPQEKKKTIPADPTVQKWEASRQLAFEPNPTLEAYLNRNYRSVSIELGAVKLNAKKQTVAFEWTSDEDSTEVEIAIVDNSYDEVWRGASQVPPLEVPVRLTPGLYYWFARVDDEIIHVGKFAVH